MKSKSTPSPRPYYFLAFVLFAAALGEITYPGFFIAYYFRFAALGFGLIALQVFLHGQKLKLEIDQEKEYGLGLIRSVLSGRQPLFYKTGPESDAAQRILSKVIGNCGEDLAEIKPDFSVSSLHRLVRFFPRLLEEIGTNQEASIRLGIVGAYLGELACRRFQWRWNFKADPSLRQFGYLASVIQRKDIMVDPFEWAAELMERNNRLKDLLEIIQ